MHNATGRAVNTSITVTTTKPSAASLAGGIGPWSNRRARPLPRSLPMMAETVPLLFVEATTADRVWKLAVQSSEGIIGHIFRVNGGYAYFAGTFNGLTATFTDRSLERLKERVIASRR